MILSDEQKRAIEEEYAAWEAGQYAGKDKKERQKLAAFFTPPPLSIKMLEKFESVVDRDVLDPTLGAGGLIAAAVFAGADPSRCYGIEIDGEILKVAKRRLLKLGVPPCNLHQGDALEKKSYDDLADGSQIKTFAVLDKLDDSVRVSVVKNCKLCKQVELADRDKLKALLEKFLEKNIKVFKI